VPLVAPWNRKKRAEREQIGHEQPGSVLRGPPIAVTCECGEKRNLGYGEEWNCEKCGRHWDTNQIPGEQYAAIRKTQLRFRVLPVLYGLLVAGGAIFFTLTGNIFSVIILLPFSMLLWFYFIRPFHRRRYRRAIAELPKWQLRPD
jgi:Flp pilus assembly protein TadB